MVVVVGSSYKLFVKPQERSRGRKYCGNKVTIVVRKTIKPEKRIVFVIHILGSFFPFDIYFLSFSLPNISSPYYPFYNRKRCLIRRKTQELKSLLIKRWHLNIVSKGYNPKVLIQIYNQCTIIYIVTFMHK